MSGQQFIETLQQIGYPKASSLSAKTFDWMFEDENVLPFLSWFCTTVGHQNILTPEEKQAFIELEQSGEAVLEGPLLQKALECLSSQHGEDVSFELLKEEVEEKKEDLERHVKKKEQMVKTRNTLSMHHSGLAHRLSKLSDVETTKKQDYRHSLEKCHRANAESNASLQRLAESVQRLCSLYHDDSPSDSERGGDDKAFLSQLRLDQFHRVEENYSRELTSFTKKLFFEGIADIAGGELSRYQLLEVSDPTSLLVKGPSEQAFLQDCEELSRLQTVFSKSEGERINALAEYKCAVNVSQVADDILRKLQNGQFPTNLQDLSGQVQEVKVTLSVTGAELRELAEGELAALVRELGTLQGTSILTGDYRLKLARQDYFTANQDQVIKYLVDQRARNEFLTMAYEIEARNHRDVNRLLTAAQQTLQDRLTQHHTRMQALSDPRLSKEKYRRGTIDTRDTATTRLHHMLVSGNQSSAERQLFLSYSSMVQGAEKLKTAHSTTKANAVSTADEYWVTVHSLEKEVGRCEDVLYADSSTVGGQPMLMPRELLEATTQLDDMLHKLEAAILDVVTDVNNKKKALKKDALQAKERDLFVYFHLHPQRLKQTVENLEKRLQAHKVK
ncbi:HAUS augmin-like complex subunit 3 [Littorina saxatilis]|uniref:HAUS augmin-like complex subunit 3 N-terminal domain-containing protein n=1 Tax=Littorina saxatilis TaxID=31220 RepID=A0AAN9BC69_9CAEN